MPFKKPVNNLGDSKERALKRFYNLEAKLQRNPVLKEKYVSFMEEYKELNHMVEVSPPSKNVFPSFYLPHHCVLNEQSSTTKLRVVFDGSAVSDSGESLNSIQLVGPTLQDELLQIILRFRQHNVVVCADIVKMYRQIQIHPSQCKLQRILWRANISEDIKIYELRTVTYGTSSAPYLAVKCLQVLASEVSDTLPEASRVISRDFYMDDMITGTNTVEEAIRLCDDVSDVLKSGCFNLQKWASNSKGVLDYIRKKSSVSPTLVFGENERTKTLGLYWGCDSDSLMYSINTDNGNRATKRSVLSDIAQIFDPLGLLGPCVIIAKVILQRLWLQKVSWDESLPSDIYSKWYSFKQQLSKLNEIKIPRHIVCMNPRRIELHGFADASLECYGACVYVRSISENETIRVSLLCAKSKVAPLKMLTIPRLELCAAFVLANLVNKVRGSMTLKIDKYFYWSDSSVCLSWIRSPPNLLQTFVGNRVAQIQSLSSPDQWNHVSSQDNPADVLSRGVNPEKLRVCDIWWKGPSWLSALQTDWPESRFKPPETIPELKKQSAVFKVETLELFPFKRFSSLSKLVRVCAFCLRFINNCRSKARNCDYLSVSELHKSLCVLVNLSQQESFPNEIKDVSRGKGVTKQSKLKKLNPFMDDNGTLRIVGRLAQSNFEFEKKHPAVLCSKHHFTLLLFRSEHLKLYHAGPQLLLYSIRNQYWPVGGRSLSKRVVHECVRCFRVKPIQKATVMGMLPKDRLVPSYPFSSCGVDYGGPVLIKNKRGRGSTKIKAYIALFICFSTKAIHLELVTELSKESFIAAFRRFVARRGRPKKVFSDNGTNFVGAKNELEVLGKFLGENNNFISESVANQGIEWHFIPAFSPHFGGVWEAGIKSCKAHLKRVLANACLVFEDFSTVLTEIEAILNSRPLTPLSSDPNDYSALTPSHFLIGRPMTSLPDPDARHINESRLSLYQRIQQMQQHFWSRWMMEYVSELQVRQKWHSSEVVLKPGMLVVVKEENAPPLQWCLGRIETVHPGRDGVARVATIKTNRGKVKRSFAKICVLPVEVFDDN